MCAYGLRPIVEIQFADYVYPALDQLISEAARMRYRSSAEFVAPLVVRMPCGGGIHGGQTHSQSPESLFTHVCGLKTVVPSNPHDAKGLLIAAIEDNDPVIFLEPKRIYNGPFDGHHERPVVPWSGHPLGEVPDGHYVTPLGSAAVRRSGEDLTVVAYGTMVFVAEAAADETGVDAEIIDLRTLLPLDTDTIEESVRKTGRCVIVHEATRTSGFGAELSAQVQERCFYALEAPIERVTGWDTPYPHAQEWDYFPGRRASAPTRPRDGSLSRRFDGGDLRRQAARRRRGVAEAEVVEWHISVGDVVDEDQPIVDVMTDKATVELPSPVAGIVARLGAEAGDVVPIGSDLVWIETDRSAPAEAITEAPETEPVEPRGEQPATAVAAPAARPAGSAAPTAAPAVRRGRGPAYGAMLWFARKTFCGSYWRLTMTSRS